MNLCAKYKQTYRYWKQTYGYQTGNIGEGDKSRSWDEQTDTTTHSYKVGNQ